MNITLAQNANRFCQSFVLEPPPGGCGVQKDTGVTLNQALAGTPNPRTKTKPTIVAPIMELSYWKTNPLSTFSHINKKTLQYPERAGLSSCIPVASSWAPTEPTRAGTARGSQGGEAGVIPLFPNIYTSTDVFEPINATNGIAITPQFPNTTILLEDGPIQLYYDTELARPMLSGEAFSDTVRTEGPRDPRFTRTEGAFAPEATDVFCESDSWACKPKPVKTEITQLEPTIYNMYDPRFSGYGAPDRNYLDPLVGSQKYFYDDVDAFRMPNYLVRSKVDSCLTPSGDSYGDLWDGSRSLHELRPLVEQSFMDNTIAHRENLMKSAMRKNQEYMVQKRIAPKYTSNGGHGRYGS